MAEKDEGLMGLNPGQLRVSRAANTNRPEHCGDTLKPQKDHDVVLITHQVYQSRLEA